MPAQTKRASRASRAAAQAENEALAAAEANAAAAQAAQDQPDLADGAPGVPADQGTPASPPPTAEPTVPTEPYARISTAEVHIPFFRPVVKVTMPDGETVETIECEHPWAHTTPEVALKCGRKIAASRGYQVRSE
jgi:hypothetical protein